MGLCASKSAQRHSQLRDSPGHEHAEKPYDLAAIFASQLWMAQDPSLKVIVTLSYWKNDDHGDHAKDASFAVVARCGEFTTCARGRTTLTAIGFTVRTREYRYTAWLKTVKSGVRRIDWHDSQSLLAEELYHHTRDESTLLNFDQGATYDVELENIAYEDRKLCLKMYGMVQARFEHLTN